MTELSTGIKVAITLVIICMVIAVTFLVLSISQVYSTSVFNENMENVRAAEVDIQDHFDQEYPMVSFKSLLRKYIEEGQITKLKVVNPKEPDEIKEFKDATINEAWKEYNAYTGHIANYKAPDGELTIVLGG